MRFVSPSRFAVSMNATPCVGVGLERAEEKEGGREGWRVRDGEGGRRSEAASERERERERENESVPERERDRERESESECVRENAWSVILPSKFVVLMNVTPCARERARERGRDGERERE